MSAYTKSFLINQDFTFSEIQRLESEVIRIRPEVTWYLGSGWFLLTQLSSD